MIRLNRKQTKLMSDSEDILVREVKDDLNPVAGLKIRKLVIHTSDKYTFPNAINHYLTTGLSRHLLIEQNGREIVQMLDFTQQAQHANEYDRGSLAVELIYMGKLTGTQGYPYSKDRFDPHEMVFARGPNDTREGWYPLYPQNQMDTLLEVCRALNQAFGFEAILVKDEIDEITLKIGPVFPRNRLRQLLAGEGQAVELMEETISEADLFTQPGGEIKMFEQPLPAHTPIVVLEDNGEWVLVEVMADVGENRWLVGWIEASKVAVQVFTPGVSSQHKLTAGLANRQIKFVEPAKGNFDPKEDSLAPEMIVIHFSTGTDFRSTIHHFLNPNSGVSAHLLLARSGLVVQFVPFNHIAYHVGPSHWENKENLNKLSIGIEVDNAGYLKESRRKGFTSQFGVPIPIEQVKSKAHWSEKSEKDWQIFPEDQVQVLEKIVRALVETYPTIKEIVGHDMVNLINRLDPGPLFPLGELRQAILGDPQPKIERWITTSECTVYENVGEKPPFDVDHPIFGELPKNSKVRVRDGEVYDRWAKVVVKSAATSAASSLNEKEGWVRSNSIEPDAAGRALTKVSQPLYGVIPATQPRFPPLVLRNLPRGRLLRKLDDKNAKWDRVAPVLEQVIVEENGRSHSVLRVTPDMEQSKFNEGWLEKGKLEKA